MWRTTLRSLLSHKLRLALSGLSIVLGVAFVVGTLVFTDTMGRTFRDLFEVTSADVNVVAAAAFDAGGTNPGAAVDTTVPESVVAEISAVDGVAVAEGNVQTAGVYVLDRDGKVLSTGGAPGIGISWDVAESVNPSTMVQGRPPARQGELALDTGTIEKSGYALGDTVALLTTGPRVEATLVGVFRFGSTGATAGASLTAFDTATAQLLLGKPGQFSGISVAAVDGVSDTELKGRVATALGPDYAVTTQLEEADAQTAALEQELAFFNVFLLVFAGVALFVGTFIILNTFSMLVAQRSKELALLRALGAGRAQVTRSVLLEALVLGVFGATVGLAGGLGIAAALRALFSSFGLTLDGSLVLSGSTVGWAYVVGVLVTLLAAYLPARRASRTAPVAAMSDVVSGPERSLRRRTVLGTLLGVVGVVALVLSSLTEQGSTAASWVGLAALSLVVAAIALSPVLAVPFLRTAGAVLPAVWGRTGHLARENALRNPRRTAATASALMIGLALVSAFSIVGTSTNASIDQLVSQGLRADFVVSTAVSQPFTPEVAQRLREVEGVQTVMQHRFGSVQVDGQQAYLTAVTADALDQTVALDYLSGSTAGLQRDGLLVDEPTAQAHGWTAGDAVEVLLPNGQRLVLTVSGVFATNQVVGSLVVALDSYEAAGGPPLDQYVYVGLADGTDAHSARPALQAAVADYPIVTLKDQGEFTDELQGSVDQVLLLINAMLALSVLIAVLGIVNTLALSVIERTREVGLLRAVGLSRRQLRTMVRLEAVIVAVLGAVLGVAMGLVFGVVLQRVIADEGIDVLSVPWARLAVFVVLAAVAGVLAAVLPARRAARLDVLRAIGTE
jgi:putative ABC transport system permease protein